MNVSTHDLIRMRDGSRRAFTLVELLIAMTITLLLMAALGKSFAVIGKTMKEGRSQVSLSSKLRGISFRLRSDLRNRTAKATPPLTTESGAGYFCYYEGPITEHTFGLYGGEPQRTDRAGVVMTQASAAAADWNAQSNSPTFRPLSRIGDTDDYIAFTAEAPGDDWFTGKVPAYLVDDSAADPMEPRVIRSKFAEIIIWASPVWDVDPTTNGLITSRPASSPQLYPDRGVPLYRDDNHDFAPDRMVLHQRVLLIRPDLNVVRTVGAGANAFETDVIRPLGNNANEDAVPAALRRLYPIGATNTFGTAAPTPLYPSYAAAASETTNSAMFVSNWLVGMAPLHQFFDLSLRRIFHPQTGDPSGYVACNSLQDLTQPHNRFAHVRYPGRYFGRGSFAGTSSANDRATSMPLLALGWNDAILNWQGVDDPRADAFANAPDWFPVADARLLRQPLATSRQNPLSPLTINSGNAGDPRHGLFNGWLLPQFELGDPNPATVGETARWQRGYLSVADSRWDRTGEDIVGSNVIAFDVKGYDRNAPVFITAGPDGQPGRAGENDDGVGGDDDTGYSAATGIATELGSIGSDDLIIRVNDIGINDLVERVILDPESESVAPGTASDKNFFAIAGRGDFVDLFYPYLAGSPFRNRMDQTAFPTTPPLTSLVSNATINSNYASFFISDLSGLSIPHANLTPIKRSGKLVHSNATGSVAYFQPMFDTWTDAYESDGFDQSQTADGSLSTMAPTLFGTTWVLNDLTSIQKDPRLPLATPSPYQVDTSRYDSGTPETSPPISVNLPAIQITVRVDDPSTHEMTQFTVVEGLQ